MFEQNPFFQLMKFFSRLGYVFDSLLMRVISSKRGKMAMAKILTSLPASVAQFVTLGHEKNSIGEWYHNNGIFKYAIDTPIALANIRCFGYGIRPVGIVKGYTKDGGYIIEMESDSDGNFFDWMNNRYVPSGNRSTCREIHFKWNAEYHFKEIPRADVILAYS